MVFRGQSLYLILLLLAMQLLAYKSIAIWFKIVLIHFIIGKIEILHLISILIQVHIFEK